MTPLAWRKSSRSGDNGGACVEVATAAQAVAIRDSNHPDGPLLTFPLPTWQTFTRQLKQATSPRP